MLSFCVLLYSFVPNECVNEEFVNVKDRLSFVLIYSKCRIHF